MGCGITAVQVCYTVVELIVFIVTHNISATLLGSDVVKLCCFFCPFCLPIGWLKFQLCFRDFC